MRMSDVLEHYGRQNAAKDLSDHVEPWIQIGDELELVANGIRQSHCWVEQPTRNCAERITCSNDGGANSETHILLQRFFNGNSCQHNVAKHESAESLGEESLPFGVKVTMEIR